MSNKKVLVIVGPTASGKSDLAVKIAKKFGGEIISADSRQVYKGLNIGTGKITKKEMWGVRHHLLDIADPKKQFSVSDFVREANSALNMIYHSGSIPIVVGGTGFYIDTLTSAVTLPEVPPNKLLRDRLEKFSNEKLFKMLEKKDSARAKAIHPNNKIRLIRALEIIETLGKVPKASPKPLAPRSFIFIGLKPEDLDSRIQKRLTKRLPGMIREAKNLIKHKKLTYKRMQELGLEYRYLALYLQKKISKVELATKLNTEIRHYAKRQMTWFSAKGGSASPEGGKRHARNKKIKWFKPSEYKPIERYVRMALLGD